MNIYVISLAFVVGFFIGSNVGVFIACLLISAKIQDELRRQSAMNTISQVGYLDLWN